MKKIVVILLTCTLLLTGCNSSTSLANGINPTENITPTSIVNTDSPTPTVEITPEPTTIPDKPKYIFIVIGDGMGQGAVSLGEMYSRIEAGDMNVGAEWEYFDQKRTVEAMGDSSSGGTAIATGCKSKQGYISLNLDQEPMYTIMDRAKEAGMDTGVISNSSLADATPAAFTAHTDSRYNYRSIVAQSADSNVDYMAGGGLRFFGGDSRTAELPTEDCYGIPTYYEGSETLMSELTEGGYSLYYGKEGAETMLNHLENQDYPDEKAVYAMSLVYMPWEIEKYKAAFAGEFDSVPNLCDMTKMGIETLSQNPDGFVMMIESAFIDKAAHMESTQREVYEVKLLNETLKTIMEFYNEHPYETLVVLTADHETGNYLYNEELFNEFKELPDFRWTDDKDELSRFLQEEWNFHNYESYYYNQVDNALKDVWDNEEDARAQVFADITTLASRKYGTIITSSAHSRQDVPLYAIGNGSDIFAECTHIAEVPIFICDIMDWDSLPEVMTEE